MSKANLRRLRTQESSEVKRAIETLRAQDGFDRCFDCGAESPDWASLAPRALVCHNCSGAHRAAALRIRSLTLDRWSLAEVHLLQQQPSQLRELIDSRANAQERANFVRRKYAEFLPKRKSVVETAPKLTVGADGRIQTRERKESFFATIGRRFRTSSRVVRDTSESEENLNLEDAEDQADLYSFEEPPDRSTLPTQFFGFLFRAGRHNRFRFKQRWLCIDTRNRRISYHHELGGEPREQCDLRGASVSQVRQVSPAWVWNPTTGHYARARRPLFCLTLRAAQLDDTQDDGLTDTCGHVCRCDGEQGHLATGVDQSAPTAQLARRARRLLLLASFVTHRPNQAEFVALTGPVPHLLGISYPGGCRLQNRSEYCTVF